MKAPSVDIKNLLEDENLGEFGAVKGWALYIGREPDAPDHCITLFDVPTASAEIPINRVIDGDPEAHRKGLVEYAGVQMRIRAPDYESSYARTDRVLKALSNRTEFSSKDGTSKYLAVWRSGDPAYIGEDDKARHIFSINIIAPRTPIGAG